MSELAPPVLWLGSFWVALAGYRGTRNARFVAALGLGAVLAHLGWALLHAAEVARHLLALLDLRAGYCVLFLPLGLIALERSAAAWRALLPALAVARIGCLVAGCCGGPAGEPTTLLEAIAYLATYAALVRCPDRLVLSGFAVAFGSIRLLVEPLRATPALGEPGVPAALLALTWIGVGAGITAFLARSRRACPVRASRPLDLDRFDLFDRASPPARNARNARNARSASSEVKSTRIPPGAQLSGNQVRQSN